MTDEIPETDSASGTGVPIHGDDIGADQIIPARSARVVTFDGFSEFAFFDQRYDEGDEPKDHPLSEPQFQDASIMVANANFGCGSPREYAPQAFMRWGIDAIVGESFTETLAGNCLALGVPTVTVGYKTVTELQDWANRHPDGDTDVDVENETVTYGDTIVDMIVDDAQRKTLTESVWDTAALMKLNTDAVAREATVLPYVGD